MRKIAISLLLICALAALAGAQKKFKPWTEWSEKDAQKMLNDSPWGQTQTETNTAEMFYNPANRGATGNPTNDAQGALNQATSINYRIRFLSAKPVRQAFARSLILKNPKMEEQLRAFAEQKSEEWIVVAVTFDAQDGRFSGPAMQAFSSAITSTLKNNTYLELKGGKRSFLEEYKAPINDGLGAKFVFKRVVDGEPFIKPDSGEVRFYSEVSRNIKLNLRFKVSDMIYDGKLEY